ncbi:GGDEF domain-containing protein [Deinococcus sp.]|uniref:GGDEF domain-containing protein n=1 Tax=Deinococcus sp. TaxID=47478 RepID=UPI003C7B9801
MYIFAVGAGTLLLFLNALVSGHSESFQRFVNPLLVVLGVIDLWWLCTGRPLNVAEYAGYAVLAAASIVHVALLSWLTTVPSVFPDSGPYWTLVCVCAVGFLALPRRLAWPLNLSLLGLCLALPWLAQGVYALHNPLAFLRLQGSVIIVTGLLGTLASLRAQVDEKGRAEEELRALAFTDSLTSLPNRRAVYPAVAALLAARQQGAAGTLHLIDIDRFKRINDEHGHAVGDQVLVEVARLIATCDTLPGSAAPTVGRWGGEEFIVVMPGTDRVLSQRRGQVLLGEFRRTPWPLALAVTASIGSSTVRPGDTFSSLLARADQALYQAKAEGRDRIVLDP